MKKFLIITLCFSFLSCANKFDHGYMFEYSNVNLLEIGVDKNTVRNLMGSPTLISDIDNEVWFYISEKTESFLFLKPKIINREILAIEFINNKVSDLHKLDLNNQLKNFKFSPKKSFVMDHKTGFFSDLFGNVGQVKPQ
jgi:outer membrane protein assembly factor BamE (lipoprotein component of BamABCDE complex)